MFAIKIPFFDIEQSCEANLFCYWRKIGPESVLVIDDTEAILVSRKKDNVCFSCSFEEFCKKWYFYFDIGYDYCMLYDRLKASLSSEEPALLQALLKRRGVRMYRAEWYECLLKAFLYAILSKKDATKAVNALTEIFGIKSVLHLYQRPSIKFKAFPSPAALYAGAEGKSVEQTLDFLSEDAAVCFGCFVSSVYADNFSCEKVRKTVSEFAQYASGFEFAKYITSEQLLKFAVLFMRHCSSNKNCFLGGKIAELANFSKFKHFATWYSELKDIAGFIEFAMVGG